MEEEKYVEEQLEIQLQEQRDSLHLLEEALASDPNNIELLSVHKDLVLAIKDAEEGLLNLKKARLLRETDSHIHKHSKNDTTYCFDLSTGAAQIEEKAYTVGSKCRFPHNDGRWYNGEIVKLEGYNIATISFLTPTSERMLICKFFLQQRCRFGNNCRFSHGVELPISSLKEYTPPEWGQSSVGSMIWASAEADPKAGIWRRAEVEAWDDISRTARVVFYDDRSTAVDLSPDSISLSGHAPLTDRSDDEESSSSSASSSFEEEEEGSGKSTFASWESHTRGMASRMMARMGYRAGMGLGVSGQGILDPISVSVLPPSPADTQQCAKRRSRGGRRRRQKKKKAEAATTDSADEDEDHVFALINRHLAFQDDGGSGRRASSGGGGGERRRLVAYDEEVRGLRTKVGRLEEMVNRNSKEKVVFEAALRKLNQTQLALAHVESLRRSASDAVAMKDEQKRWLKF